MALTSSSFHQNLSNKSPNSQTDNNPAQSTTSQVAGLTGLSGSTGELWSQPGGKGTPITLTYSFVDGFFDHVKIKGGTPNDVKTAVEKALSLYAKYAPLNFVEVKDHRPDTLVVQKTPRKLIWQGF